MIFLRPALHRKLHSPRRHGGHGVRSEQTTDRIIGAAITVHRKLGPGLLESAYETCLLHELQKNGLRLERQKTVPLVYEGIKMECGYRADLIVDSHIIVEIKSVDRIEPVHSAQLLTYMKLASCTVGLLINFNVTLLKDGIRRFVL